MEETSDEHKMPYQTKDKKSDPKGSFNIMLLHV